MKKSTIMIPVICLLALASCGGNPSPSAGNSDSVSGQPSTSDPISDSTPTPSPSTPVPATDWTEAEKTLMKDHLSNYVLPYMAIPGHTTAWDETYETINIVTETGGKVGMDTDYKAVLEAAGFLVTYYDIYGIYQGDKTIENGVAVYAQFVLSSTTFAIHAWAKAPLTAWPADGIVEFFTTHELEVKDTVPSFAATYYFATDYYDDYECYTVSVRDMESVAVSEEVYTKTLTEAGWTIDKTQYEEVGVLAYAPNNTIKLNYYLMGSIFSIDIYRNIPKQLEWPAEAIATILGDKITEVALEFLWDTGYIVEAVAESDTEFAHVNILIDDVTGTEEEMIAATETAYNELFTAANWIIDDTQYADYGYMVTSPKEEITIQHYLATDGYHIVIYRAHDLSGYKYATEWPTADVAAALPTGGTVLPAVTGGSLYVYKGIELVDGTSGIKVRTVVADMAAAKTTYETALVTAGFSKYLETEYYVDNATTPTIKVLVSTQQLSTVGYQYLVVQATNFPEPVIDGVFDMSKSTQKVSLTADQAVYQSGVVTMTIDKNGSTTDVGGENQAFMPATNGFSRLYTSQKITIDVTNANIISSIVVTTGGGKGAEGISAATITGGTAVAVGDVVTITADAGQSKIEIVVSKQVRVSEIAVNFSAKA